MVGFFVTALAAKPLSVLAVTDDFASIARSIGGDAVRVQSLVQGSRDLHAIDPRPSMVLALRKSDLLIRLGMRQDAWLDGIIQLAGNSRVMPGKPGYLDCSLHIVRLEVPTGTIDGRMGDVHRFGNPHYWLNPKNGIVIAEQIRDHLIALDPKNRQLFETNFKVFKTTIDTKFIEWDARLKKMESRDFITYHRVWTYFFDAFGLTSLGQLEPVPGIPPTTKHLSALSATLKKTNSKPIILVSSFYSKEVGQHFAQSRGLPFKHLHTNVGEKGIKDYVQLFDYLVKELTL